MKKLIDKSALVAEIEKELNATKKYSTEYVNGKKYALKKILSFIGTLEVKEVDLVEELDELKEKCVQAMQDVDNFVSEHYDKLCNEIKEQWNVPDNWQIRVISNCEMVSGCYRQSDKDEWFRVIYNNGFWFDNNFL